ncbi:cyclodehydratase, partial [Rhizobium leguminosarum]
MDWFHTVPRWHPRFRPVLRAPQAPLAPSSLPEPVLVEDTGALQLPFAEAGVLAGLVDGGLSPAAWCAAGGDPRHLPGLLMALESLSRQRCVVPSGPEDPGRGWRI